MRLYTWTNYMLSGIQKGIQTAHVVSELARMYRPGDGELGDMFYEWAEDHMTIVVLDGGNSDDIGMFAREYFQNSIWRVDAHRDYQGFPAALFEEDESLNNAVTAFGIVVPPSIYEEASRRRTLAQFQSHAAWPTIIGPGSCNPDPFGPGRPVFNEFEEFVISKIQYSQLASN